MCDISFIIPVYNKKINQLKNCVESISLKNLTYEIILVDDGSDCKDSSSYRTLIADKNNAFYFRKKHNGVSAARNYGIDLAKGKYIFFLDADDVFRKDAIKKDDIKTQEDLIIYDVDIIDAKNDRKQVFSINVDSPTIKDLMNMTLLDGLMNWSVAKLYKKDFLKRKKAYFNTQLIAAEDLDFIINILFNRPTFKYYSRVVYDYLYDDQTSINRILNHPSKTVDNIKCVYKNRKKVLKKLNAKNNDSRYIAVKINTVDTLFLIFSELVNCKKDTSSIYAKVIDIINLIQSDGEIRLKDKVLTNLKIKLLKHKKNNLINFWYLYIKFKKNYLSKHKKIL